ncbi:MAG: DUF3500 domain-containing protein [Hymenobacter sp.]|nr:MAG: DUF3500 domain-containing protein [Hymenobacter sp.]
MTPDTGPFLALLVKATNARTILKIGTSTGYSTIWLADAVGDYVRIDGPNVWSEFVCQNGIVYHSQIHYHSIWRDRTRDYGGNFYGPGRG